MERADSCRRAARDAVSDVEPAQLHEYVEATLAEASMVPAVFSLETASELGSRSDLAELTHQAAGVQLIYEGLRLTRTLARTEPWEGHEGDDEISGDLEILAADILVARGFYLLARTDAAGKAVRTVQEFGRAETRHTESEEPSTMPILERNVLELAALTGASAAGETPTESQLARAAEIAETVGTGFPPAVDCFPPLESGPTETFADDGSPTDRATSVSDP